HDERREVLGRAELEELAVGRLGHPLEGAASLEVVADEDRVDAHPLAGEEVDLVAPVDAARAAVERVDAGAVRRLVADEDDALAGVLAPGELARGAERALDGLGAAASLAGGDPGR